MYEAEDLDVSYLGRREAVVSISSCVLPVCATHLCPVETSPCACQFPGGWSVEKQADSPIWPVSCRTHRWLLIRRSWELECRVLCHFLAHPSFLVCGSKVLL